jgi:uncharacterized membrane protein YcgQ (UPF0703/DUF1980 family)
MASVFIVSGCGGGAAKKNNAGTQSVILPGAIPGNEKTGNTTTGNAASGNNAVIETAASGGQLSLVTRNPDAAVVEIKEKMFIAQTNDIYLNAEDYLGRTIKLEGLFKVEQYTGRDTPYCFVLRYGPGCCGTDGNAGFEVAWDNALTLQPAIGFSGYPDADDWVEAAGELKYYEEDGYPYLYIALSSLTVLEERGAEFVTQ